MSELKNTICAKTIQFGKCRVEDDLCQVRHCLNPNTVFSTQGESVIQEKPDKQIDEIRFTVLRVQSPVSYWTQIHQPGANQPEVSQDQILLQLSLALYYSKPKNRIIESVNNLKVGELVCVKGKDDNYERAKITFVHKVCLLGTELVEKVEVQYLETGENTTLGKTSIYRLADQFKEVPPLAQLVVLAGYKPPDKDENWSTDCINHIQRSVIPPFLCAKDDYYECRGKILLRSPEIIWIAGCEVWEVCRTRLTYNLEIGEEIISTKTGVRNKEHYLQIRRLGEEVGLEPTPLLRKLSLHPGTGYTNLLDSQPTQLAKLLDQIGLKFFRKAKVT
ncbi:uncharacterized protein LOC111706419 [Eurytemora carolleeae]|uniref:uncharacterized protein LOC111706419 n=1 Tax=Eurytemora carolleeae TaxID=1294199 RepID=UPI000C78A32B|nr:uncharacterized protein LOC111706419 [Eurytemora carolleeae]|eukprot:XP_023335063.1 uncharacterized protein LOC111706419 [Eurytemora affinis]